MGTSRFNPRARAGRDGGYIASALSYEGFNPRARAGRDHRTPLPLDVLVLFQSTRPRGARPKLPHLPHPGFQFQSTRPRGARHLRKDHRSPVRGGFNPRARAGRDITLSCRIVSFVAFQSTRPRGARRLRDRPVEPGRLGFNPRARAGRDLLHGYQHGLPSLVSIHAPARGATVPDSAICPRLSSFNPRARAGRDAEIPIFKYREDKFQSTRPRGARHVEHPVLHRNRHVSIHAPARGATSSIRSGHPHRFGFNPRARAGRDDVVPPLRARRFSFNPRARAGRDSMSVESKHKEYLFQSTRPRGARRI